MGVLFHNRLREAALEEAVGFMASDLVSGEECVADLGLRSI